MSNFHKFKAGFVQFDVKLDKISANFEKIQHHIKQLSLEKVRLAVLPEMWSCGFDNENLYKHACQTPEILDSLSKTAQKYKMVIVGSMPEASDKKIFNTQYVVDADGSLAGAYRKAHLFSLTGEEKYFAGGRENKMCETSVGKLGLMVCYDLRFPELCRTLTLKGAQIIIVSAQWPQVRISRWDVLAQARAIENQVYLVAANRCGVEKGTIFGGRSVIVDPTGDVLVQADQEICARSALIDFEKMAKVREKMPSLNERVPEAYHV